MRDAKASESKRWVWFAVWLAISSLLFVRPLIALARLCLSSDDASYLALIPVLTIVVLFLERTIIFRNPCLSVRLGGIFLVLAASAAISTRLLGTTWPTDLQLTGYIFALILLWIAGFALFFGKNALSSGQFAFLFLFLAVPIPNFFLSRLIYVLQAGSTDVAGALFDLLGVPALREGFVFHLAHVNIEVAKQCSGIRSSMALLVLALLVSHFYLRRLWKQTVFVACGVLVMVLKNGIRIVTLTLLASYVDPGFLSGDLHHKGGIVFFLVGLLILLPILLLLRKGENAGRISAEPIAPQSAD